MTGKRSIDFLTTTDILSPAQRDMCRAYANGSVGIISSGLIWLLSAIVAWQYEAEYAIRTLLVGAMFIHPLSILLSKISGLSGSHEKDNPLGKPVMEGTIFMVMCIPLAYGLSWQHPEWFFQGMLLIIGGRYLTFATIYGQKFYWLLGGILGLAAILLFKNQGELFISALTGALIETGFGLFIFIRFRMNSSKDILLKHSPLPAKNQEP